MKKSSEYQNDVRHYPNRYRKAVTKVFVKFINSEEGREIGTPKKIIQEFAHYANESYVDLKNSPMYKKLENLRGGRLQEPVDDMHLFGLMERFVWNNKPTEIADILLRREVHELAQRLSQWHNLNADTNMVSRHTNHGVDINYIDDGVVYKIGVEEGFEVEDVQPDTYVAIKRVENEPYDLCFIFCHPWPRNLFVGFYLRSASTLFLRDTMSRFPCTISMRIVNAAALIGISTNFCRQKGDYSGGRLTDTKKPEVMVEVKNGVILNLAKEMFERFRELIDEVKE